MKPAIQLISEYNSIPKGAIFTKYKTSPDLFDFDRENFIVHYKNKEVLLPPNLIRLIEDQKEIEQLLIINEKNLKSKSSPDPKDFIKALQLLKEAEAIMFNDDLVRDENKFRTFLEENNVSLNRSPRIQTNDDDGWDKMSN